MKLILTPFTQAITSLEEALNEYAKDNGNTFVRDSCIQRFEYTYELSWKMLKRYLMASEPSSTNVSEMNFQSLIRLGSDKGLLKNDWESWKLYRDARNSTCHTYNEKKALEVMAQIPGFFLDAKFLEHELSDRNDN